MTFTDFKHTAEKTMEECLLEIMIPPNTTELEILVHCLTVCIGWIGTIQELETQALKFRNNLEDSTEAEDITDARKDRKLKFSEEKRLHDKICRLGSSLGRKMSSIQSILKYISRQ